MSDETTPRSEDEGAMGNISSSMHMTYGPIEVDIIHFDDEKIILRMPITPETHQPYGLLHGGVSMLLAETAASMHAIVGIDIAEKQPVGIEINGSHVRSARDGHALAIGTRISRSSSLVVHQVEIRHEETDRLLSTIRVTNYYRRSR